MWYYVQTFIGIYDKPKEDPIGLFLVYKSYAQALLGNGIVTWYSMCVNN